MMSLSIYPVMHSGFTDGEDYFCLWYFPIREKSFMTGYVLALASVLPCPCKVFTEKVDVLTIVPLP